MEEENLDNLTTQQLIEIHTMHGQTIRALQAKQSQLHEEITRREHAEWKARMHPDRSLDQEVKLG